MKKTSPLRTRVTRRFYRWLFRFYRLLFPTRVPPGPVAPANIRRLLIARIDRVGDLVVLSPALSYLRDALPDAEIDLLAGPRNASLFAHDPRLTHVYVHQPTALGWLRSVWRLRRRHYDVVFTMRLRDHMYEGIFAALVAGRHGVRYTGYRPPQYAGFFTHQTRIPQSRTHIVARLLYLARALTGALPAPPVTDDLAAHPPTLPANPAAEARVRAFVTARLGGRQYVALNAWGQDPRRSFDVGYAAELAAAIAARRPALAIIVTPPPGRDADAAEIARRAVVAARAAGTGDPLIAAFPASPDLADIVALVRGAAVVVTPDTANVHFASALGVPLVAVYTPLAVNETQWGAWGTPRRVVRLAERLPLREVPVTDVAAACVALWDEQSGVRGDLAAAPAAAPPGARGVHSTR